MEVGIVSLAMSRELLYATSARELADRMSRYKASGSPSAIWAELSTQQVIGARGVSLAGIPR
jgi:hypothetical protein